MHLFLGKQYSAVIEIPNWTKACLLSAYSKCFDYSASSDHRATASSLPSFPYSTFQYPLPSRLPAQTRTTRLRSPLTSLPQGLWAICWNPASLLHFCLRPASLQTMALKTCLCLEPNASPRSLTQNSLPNIPCKKASSCASCACAECHVWQPGQAWRFFTGAELQRKRTASSESLPNEHDFDNDKNPLGNKSLRPWAPTRECVAQRMQVAASG